MSKINKVIACIQILIFLSLIVWSGSGATIGSFKKSGEFPCKEHACGCKSEADCKTHCCCSPQENQRTSQYDGTKQRNSLRSFINSLKCKSGSDAITFINTNFKYILEDKSTIHPLTFFCFLTGDAAVHLREVMVSPPEKPPRCFA